MLAVSYRPRAAYDIESIIIYLGRVLSMPQAAASWRSKLNDAIELLCEMPELGRVFADDRLEIHNRRTYLVDNYRIFYSCTEDALVIWRVLHVSQDIDDYAMVSLLD